jgi:gliding motility-associated-like protein
LVIHPNPAVSAGPDKMIQSGTSTTLDGSILNPANYSLFWTPSQFLNNTSILNPTATPPAGSYTYQLIATDKSTFCRNSDEMVLNVLDKLAIPTGFTPNGDGKNDRWRIIGLGLYPNAKMRVFDRAGQIVFDGNANTIGWDGRFRGSPMNGGVYVYMIELNDPQKQVLRGTLSLIR